MLSSILVLLFLIQVPQDPGSQKDRPKTQDYIVGAGDVISVRVFGMKEFDQVLRVSNSGKIHVPYVGILKVHGLSISQVESMISKELVRRQLVKEPWVQITVAEYRAHPVYILGEVQFAGQFIMTKEMRLLDLIGLAGGFSDVYNPVGYLYRRKAPDDLSQGDSKLYLEDEVIKIDFAALHDDSQPEKNILLRGGDILYVPQRKIDHFFVVGDVLSPGAFELPVDHPILATQAIAMAGGPSRTAKMKNGMLMRYTENGVRQEHPVDFQAILRGGKPNLSILPNDIIYIPGSNAKTLGYGFLNMIPQMLTGVALY